VRLAPGESITVNDYTFRFEGVADHQGPNYVAQRGPLTVSHDGFVETLHPEKRIYRVQQNPMTEDNDRKFINISLLLGFVNNFSDAIS